MNNKIEQIKSEDNKRKKKRDNLDGNQKDS